MKNLISIAVLALLTAFSIAYTWKVEGNSATVMFTSGKINGSFTGLKAGITFDKSHPEKAKFSASIDATSVTTGFFLKNSHAKDALGTDKYPLIKFVSTSVTKGGEGYIAKGQLTMKGVSRPASINFTFTENEKGGVFKGNLKVAPKDFGIDRSGTPPLVTVDLVVPVMK
jgi:polyisoprenoid-binding protein YceI